MKHPWDRRLGFWWIAEEHPTQPAVVASPSGVTLTYAELAGRAHQVVHALRAHGLGTGDIFAYALPNSVDMLYWQLAANEGGFQPIALNPALSGAEIQRIVDHSGAAALVLHSDFADRVDQMSGTRVDHAPGLGRRRHPGLHDRRRRSSTASRRPSLPTAPWASPSSTPRGRPGSPRPSSGPPRRAIDPSVAADALKSFGHAFQFQPLSGVHLVSAGMHHGGCQGFYLGRAERGPGPGHPGQVRPREDAGRHRAVPGHHRLHGAHPVRPDAPPARRGEEEVRPLEPAGRRALGRPVPARGQAADDGVVGPGDLGDLRRHGGCGHHRQALPLDGEAGHRGSLRGRHVGEDPRRGRERAPARRGRPRVPRTRARALLRLPQRPGADRLGQHGATRSPWATSATWTRTATCSSTTGPRT